MAEDLVARLRKRAAIRRQIPTRKSVAAGERDRLADLLDEAAAEIERLRPSPDLVAWWRRVRDGQERGTAGEMADALDKWMGNRWKEGA